MRLLRLLFLVSFLPAISWGAVTQAQAKQAQAAAQQLLSLSQKMLLYANAVNNLFDSGFALTIAGSTETVTIPQATQDKLIDIAKYQALKAQLAAAYNQLP